MMAEIGYIQVTRECNSECIICSNPPTESRLEFADAKQQVDDLVAKQCQGVILTGGEPTLYPQLAELIEYCVSKNLFPRIITNGQKTADSIYLKELRSAGLRHMHISVYSCRNEVQSRITQNKNSLVNIQKSFQNLCQWDDMTVDVNTVINAYNADHLSETVFWILENFGYVKHFVFNNLDPLRNRVVDHPEVIAKLNDFEWELHKALNLLTQHNKTFRVERVPLCYLTDFEHVSTETRKIVKGEKRTIYFLDKRGEFNQDDWFYRKVPCCDVCRLNAICAGLYAPKGDSKEKELYPVFIDPESVKQKVGSDL